MVNWISVKDKLPVKSGRYLVVKHFFNYKRIEVMNYALNLSEIDEYDFGKKNKPGWFDSDSECGYYEVDGITFWAELPDFPEENNIAQRLT